MRDKSSCLAVGEKGTSSCLSPSPEEAKYTTSTKRKHNEGEMCRNRILLSNCHAQRSNVFAKFKSLELEKDIVCQNISSNMKNLSI